MGGLISKILCQRNYNKEINIGHVGRLKKKNHETIIEVFKEINQIYPNIQLILVGEGSKKLYIEELAKSYQIDEHIKFIGRTEK